MARSHILDDFIFIGPPNSVSYLQDLNRFIAFAGELQSLLQLDINDVAALLLKSRLFYLKSMYLI